MTDDKAALGGELLFCHECRGTGLIGRMVGARHQCNLCEGEGKFRDRRALLPAQRGEDDLLALAEAWVLAAREHMTARPLGGTDETRAWKAMDAARDAFIAALPRSTEGLAAHLLRQHRCNSDGAMTVGECVDSKRCGCSCKSAAPAAGAERRGEDK